MVRKSNELRRGVAKYKKMNGFSGDKDLELKHRLKRAAGTILPCLKGDHSNCNQYSSVCADSKDPFLHLLPRNRNVSSIPDQISQTIAESIWSVFRSEKLDYLIRGGALRTTSCVEAVHRTIRNPAPKANRSQRIRQPFFSSGRLSLRPKDADSRTCVISNPSDFPCRPNSKPP